MPNVIGDNLAPQIGEFVADKIHADAVAEVIHTENGMQPVNANGEAMGDPFNTGSVIEAYPRTGQTELSSTWLSTTSGGSALTPETGKIYVLMADSTSYATNTQFRWGGTAYVKLADGGVSAITNAEIDTICV